MMYVDLNPIRAGINKTPETSDFTSIQERLKAIAHNVKASKKTNKRWSKNKNQGVDNQTPLSILLPFTGNEHKDRPKRGIPFPLKDYLELLDWTGRAIRSDKKGAIPKHITPILQRLNLNDAEWLNNVQDFEQRFFKVVGKIEAIRRMSISLEQAWLNGVSNCNKLYRQVA